MSRRVRKRDPITGKGEGYRQFVSSAILLSSYLEGKGQADSQVKCEIYAIAPQTFGSMSIWNVFENTSRCIFFYRQGGQHMFFGDIITEHSCCHRPVSDDSCF